MHDILPTKIVGKGASAMDKFIYMDNAATTKVAKEVLDSMIPYFTEFYGNPSSAYTFSGKIADEVLKARGEIAATIGAKEREILFTGGGSESDNWALKGVADALKEKGNHSIMRSFIHVNF